MSHGPDAGTLVERALGAAATRAGVSLTVMEAVSTRWASATFTGARHVLELRLSDSDAARAWLGTLGEADLPLRGHLLADCEVVYTRAAEGWIDVRVEALTVEER